MNERLAGKVVIVTGQNLGLVDVLFNAVFRTVPM